MAVYNIKDQQSVNAWIQRSDELTQQANSIMQGVSAVMEEISQDSRGGMVDRLVESGRRVSQSTANLIGTMKEISDDVRRFVDNFSKAVDTVSDLLTSSLGVFG